MKKFPLMLAGLALAVASSLPAQQQPKPKSQKEVDAVMAIMNAQNPDAQIAAAENLLTKFADTEFKAIALQVATQAAQQKNDYEKMMVYGERTLQADAKNYAVRLLMSQGMAQRTREHDLDKEEKLTQAGKYATEALELIKTAAKPRPDIEDAQWEGAKKDFAAQGNEALGMIAMVRKKYDAAITAFKTAVENSPDAATKVRLASAYTLAGNYDAAIPLLDAVSADPNAHPTVKQIAGQEKLKAAQAKAAKK